MFLLQLTYHKNMKTMTSVRRLLLDYWKLQSRCAQTYKLPQSSNFHFYSGLSLGSFN